jgi:alpha-glucosidase
MDYIAGLGVEGIWLSPFFTSPMADFGYDVSDYQNVDPLFGTLSDFDELLTAAHTRGLKVIIDLVMSHTSKQHFWFSDSCKRGTKSDWYVWADPKEDGTPPNNWLSVFGGSAWEYDTKRGQYYYHQFLKEQPDLNLRNPEVQEEMLRIMEWWMQRGVDGFRLDALNHCIHDAQLRDNPARRDVDRSAARDRFTHPYSWQYHQYDKNQPEMIPFIKRIRALTDKYPGRFLLAEVSDDNRTLASYTDGPSMLHTAYSFSLLTKDSYGVANLRRMIEDYFSIPGDSWPSWAFSNHDVVRVATRWAQEGKYDAEQAKMLIALLTSLKGTAFLYQGEELGMTEADIPFDRLQDPFGIFLWPEDKGRDGCRTPMPWDAQAKNAGFSNAPETWLPVHASTDVAKQESDKESPLSFTRNFLSWRKKQDLLAEGDIKFHDAPEHLLAFTREKDNKKLLCCFNMSAQKISFPAPKGFTLVEGHGLPHKEQQGQIHLPPFGGFYAKM